MDQQQVNDLVEFLRDHRPPVRHKVAEAVAGMTMNPEDREMLLQTNVAQYLARLVGDTPSVAGEALKALINLSDNAGMLGQMLRLRLCSALIENLKDHDWPHKKLSVLLLSNLCQTHAGCLQLMQRDEAEGSLMGLNFRRLLQWFLQPVTRDAEETAEADPFEFAGNILHNVTQLDEARTILVDPERGILPSFVQQLRSHSVIRRRGAAGVLRNVSFKHQSLDYLLSPSVDLLSHLVRPLVGPEPLSASDKATMPGSWTELGRGKQREPDPKVRRWLVEALVILGAQRKARDAMRARNVYAIVRALHLWLEGALNDVGEADGVEDEALAAERAAARVSAEQATLAEQGLLDDDPNVQLPTRRQEDDDEEEVAGGGMKSISSVLKPHDDEATIQAIGGLVNYLKRPEGEDTDGPVEAEPEAADALPHGLSAVPGREDEAESAGRTGRAVEELAGEREAAEGGYRAPAPAAQGTLDIHASPGTAAAAEALAYGGLSEPAMRVAEAGFGDVD